MILHELANDTNQKRFSGARRFMWWWRRSVLVAGACSGELYCDGRTGVDGDGELRMILSTKKGSRRCTSSPGGFLGSRRRRLSTEIGAVSPIPASTCERELVDSLDWMRPGSIPSSDMILRSSRTSQHPPRAKGRLKSMASFLTGTRVSWYLQEWARGMEEMRFLGFPGGGRSSYRQQGAVAFIESVGVASVDRAPCSSPPSCFLTEVEDDRNGKLAGLRGWVSGRLGLGPDGLRPGECFPLFFSFDSFLFIYYFLFCYF
jgi:hypothetical protein